MDWIKPGGKAYVYHYGSIVNPATADEVTIERLTKTQIIVTRGRRFNRETLSQIGNDGSRWGAANALIAPDDPRVEKAAREAQVRRLRNAAHEAVDAWKTNAGKDPKKARDAAKALLAYADGAK